MRGPPKKPTAVKLIEGTFRRDRAPRREPRPVPGVPRRPRWLDARGATKWRQLVAILGPMHVVTVADGDALALAAEAFSRFLAARDAVRQFGTVYSSATPAGGTIVRPRPECAMATSTWRDYLRALQEFGLTPAARARVEARDDGGSETDRFLFDESRRRRRA